MLISTKGKPVWMSRPRKRSEYWSGMGGAKGWCIFESFRAAQAAFVIMCNIKEN